jgi:hypothetical protein
MTKYEPMKTPMTKYSKPNQIPGTNDQNPVRILEYFLTPRPEVLRRPGSSEYLRPRRQNKVDCSHNCWSLATGHWDLIGFWVLGHWSF